MPQGSVKHHKDLLVWQNAIELVAAVYTQSNSLPAAEQFGLMSQMRRAAVSIPANIAEGAARGSTAEFARFVLIARGSLAELETHLHVATRLGMMKDTSGLMAEITILRRMLINLHRALLPKRFTRSPN
jgi:four helix bundle protein